MNLSCRLVQTPNSDELQQLHSFEQPTCFSSSSLFSLSDLRKRGHAAVMKMTLSPFSNTLHVHYYHITVQPWSDSCVSSLPSLGEKRSRTWAHLCTDVVCSLFHVHAKYSRWEYISPGFGAGFENSLIHFESWLKSWICGSKCWKLSSIKSCIESLIKFLVLFIILWSYMLFFYVIILLILKYFI